MNTIPDQEQYWDKVSEEKEFPTPFQIGEFGKYISKEMHILDIGCGYGRTLNELYNSGFRNLVGIDFSQGMITRGLKMYPHLKLIKNDNDILPFPDNSFEAVILIAVLTCIAEEKEQHKLITEVLRVLKAGGILYINDFLINQDQRNVERYNKHKEKYGTYGIFELFENGVTAVVRHHSKEHIIAITKDFQEMIFEPVIYITMNGNKSNGFYYIGKKK